MYKVWRSLLTTVLLAGTLGACSPSARHWLAVRQAEQALKAEFTDPSSAEFRGVTYHAYRAISDEHGPLPIVCGEVNSKNRMGGYVGFTRFVVTGSEALVEPTSDADQSLKDAFDGPWRAGCERPLWFGDTGG